MGFAKGLFDEVEWDLRDWPMDLFDWTRFPCYRIGSAVIEFPATFSVGCRFFFVCFVCFFLFFFGWWLAVSNGSWRCWPFHFCSFYFIFFIFFLFFFCYGAGPNWRVRRRPHSIDARHAPRPAHHPPPTNHHQSPTTHHQSPTTHHPPPTVLATPATTCCCATVHIVSQRKLGKTR